MPSLACLAPHLVLHSRNSKKPSHLVATCAVAMGVRGLLSYILRHSDSCTVQADLVHEANRHGRHGVTLLVDLADFCAWFLAEADQAAKGWPDGTLTVAGGDFVAQDEAVTELVLALRHAGGGT